ncbi:hypothetical protein GCM10022251_79120 [Phytohabitans flavus]|uniref:Uncharacterized protein n=1 Tax=Phytohabitans flavus TaxID=1076124 RepID=A0A6F8XLT1_9ACTN|nr:hypothetical protein Pflav_011940 [Phytohabitans flavus]
MVLSSVAAMLPRCEVHTYAAAKAGLDAYARGLGQMVRGTGARVLVVRPGQVRTRMTAGLPDVPFTVGPDQVAVQVAAALHGRASVVYIPAPLRPVTAGLRLLPAPLRRAVLGRPGAPDSAHPSRKVAAAPSSQPATTSVGQCATSATRLHPTSTAQATATSGTSVRTVAFRATSSATSATVRAVTVALVVCPDGYAQPADAVSRPAGRGRPTAYSTPSRTILALTVAATVNAAARYRRRHTSQATAAATAHSSTGGSAVCVTADQKTRHPGCVRANDRA